MHRDQVVVNGLELPAGLVRAVRDGSWSRRASSGSLAAVFGSAPVRPRFLSLEQITAVNRHWKDQTSPLYIGHANASRYPGDIDPKRSLIVAELGPDELIALDYRRTVIPEVLFSSHDIRSPWILVAGSVEELLSKLPVPE
jgi:hypothetical protein